MSALCANTVPDCDGNVKLREGVLILNVAVLMWTDREEADF